MVCMGDSQAMHWIAQIDCTAEGLGQNDLADLTADVGGGLVYDSETAHLRATFEVGGATVRAAVDEALRIAQTTIPGEPQGLRVVATDVFLATENRWTSADEGLLAVEDMRRRCAAHAEWMTNHPEASAFAEGWADRNL
jgi:hypothetical protein